MRKGKVTKFFVSFHQVQASPSSWNVSCIMTKEGEGVRGRRREEERVGERKVMERRERNRER